MSTSTFVYIEATDKDGNVSKRSIMDVYEGLFEAIRMISDPTYVKILVERVRAK